MLKTHKIRLNPTPEQAEYFRRAAGVARFVFNWGLAQWQAEYGAGRQPTALKLKAAFNAVKGEQFPWVYDVTKTVVEGAFMSLGAAFHNYFLAQREGRSVGYPQFKSKKRHTQSFYVSNDKFEVQDHMIRIPKLGWVNMTERLRFSGKIMRAVVSYRAGWWWVAITVDVPHTPPLHTGPAIGIDLGVKHLATCSTGQVFENQKHLKAGLRKIKQLHRAVSRKVKGSHNREKAIRRLAKAYFRVACRRRDMIHKMTTTLTQHASLIGLEDLNVTGMLKNHRLAQAISDASFGEIRRQLVYKAAWYGGAVQIVDRFYPSSKLCNGCGWRNAELTLSVRYWQCPQCQRLLDRDLNAAWNIRDEAIRLYAASR